MKIKRNTPLTLTCVASVISATFSINAFANDFEFGDGWRGSWSGTLSYSAAWRAKSADSALYGVVDGAATGLSAGTGNNNVDEGNVNYKKGDQFTGLYKLIVEVGAQKEDLGFLIRGKAWYDDVLNNNSVHLGSQNNGYNSSAPLSDRGFDNLSKFNGTQLLDAYVYDTFDVAGKPLQVRLGNQVVNWGESLFIQGVNQISPLDVPSFHKPGAQLKEVFIPVPILFASQSLGDVGSLEAFYQFKWRPTPLDIGCGNYWSLALGNIARNPGTCNNGIGLVPGASSAVSIAANAYIPTINSKKPNGENFGLAYRFNVPKLDTEFGLYAIKIDSRTPVISVQKGSTTLSPMSVMWEYPEAEKIFGLSAATNILGWSIGAEYSQTHDAPAQIDGNDLLYAGLGAGGAVVPGISIPFGPYGQAGVAAFAGSGYLPGYTRTRKNQLNINALKAGNGILGAAQYVFIAEAAVQTNNLDLSALRYNRPFIFGPGPSATYGAPCAALNISQAGCKNDGYTTHSAWGYRAKLDLTYNDVFAGVTVIPSVFWSHDVNGYSMDSQFVKSRQVLGLSAKFSYVKKYSLELGATTFNHGADYDALRDRDYYSATISASF